MLASAPITLMGSGIGAVRVPDILRAATDALQIAGTVQLQIDVKELPLTEVADGWATSHHRSRVVFTV